MVVNGFGAQVYISSLLEYHKVQFYHPPWNFRKFDSQFRRWQPVESTKYGRGRCTEEITTVKIKCSRASTQILVRIIKLGKKSLPNSKQETQVSFISRLRTTNNKVIVVKEELENMDKHRIFGVDKLSNLIWNEHFNDIANKTAKKLGFLNWCLKSQQV